MDARRPVVAIAVYPGLERVVVPAPLIERLRRSTNLVSEGAIDLASHDIRLREIEVVLGGWGCPPIDERILRNMPNLRMLAYAAGSTTGTATDAVWRRNIIVTGAAHANAIPFAEFVLAAIIFAGKDVFRRRDEWRASRGGRSESAAWGNRGMVVGVIGADHTARLVCARLKALECAVLVCDPAISDAEASSLGVRPVSFEQLLRHSNVVSTHMGSTPALRLGADELAFLRDGAFVVNAIAGGLVDIDALSQHAAAGRLNALLDATSPQPLPADHVLWELPNVVLTPGVAGPAGGEVYRLGEAAVVEIERYCLGLAPLHPADRH